MAIVRTSALIASISGSIGTANFANSRVGTVLRPRAQKTNPQSAAQQTARARYSQAVKSWSTLSALQRQLWNNVALQYAQTNRLGAPRLLSGFQLYVKNVIRALTSSHSPSAAPPAPLIYSPLISVTLDYQTAVAFNATWLIGVATYPTRVDLFGMRGFNRPTNWTPRNFKYFAHIAPTASPAATNIRSNFETAFGVPSTGETVWIRSVPTNLSTFLSPAFIAKAVVHA